TAGVIFVDLKGAAPGHHPKGVCTLCLQGRPAKERGQERGKERVKEGSRGREVPRHLFAPGYHLRHHVAPHQLKTLKIPNRSTASRRKSDISRIAFSLRGT